MTDTPKTEALEGVRDIEFRLRIARLLAELHGEEKLSEQQCARYMDIDLVSWRKLEHCFTAGTSFIENDGEAFPIADSESVLRAALGVPAAPRSAAPGWVLVPVEPTPEMIKQMVLAWLSQQPGDSWDACAESAWKRGVAAVLPPVTPSEGGKHEGGAS